MAGTGHSYEIVNIGKVRETLGAFAADLGYPEAAEWFAAPHVVRFATAEAFVARLQADDAAETVAAAAEPAERDILLGKLASGGDLRLFVPDFFHLFGPDLRHVADWLAALPKSDPRMVRKLHRVSVTAAVSLAERWSAALARKAATRPGQGDVEVVLEPETGRVWAELKDEAALAAESAVMGHCVHSYGARLARGTRIFSLRDRNGRHQVTLEAVPLDGGGLAVGQIRTRANHLPDQCYRPDIARMLDWLGARRDAHGEAAAIGLVQDGAGRWRWLADVAERYDIGDMAAYGLGATLYVISPRNPQETVAAVTGQAGWWRRLGGPAAPDVAIGTVGGRRYGIEDQRAVAKIANSPLLKGGRTPANSYLGFLVRKEGAWVPRADAWETWEVDGVPVLLDHQGTVHVTRPGEKAETLVTVFPKEPQYRYTWSLVAKVAAGAERREWSVEEVRRVGRVLSALGVAELDHEDGGIRDAGLSHVHGARWARFEDEVVQHPYLGPRPDGREISWAVAPWRAELRRSDGKILFSMSLAADGTLTGASGLHSAASLDHLRDAARLLTELRIGANGSYLLGWDRASGLGWSHIPARPGEEAGKAAMVPICGEWAVVTSEAELLDALRPARRQQFKDAATNEAACRLLPPRGSAPETDALLAKHLAAWAARATADDMTHNVLRSQRRPDRFTTRQRAWTDERLIDALALEPLMLPRERAALARAAAGWLRKHMGRDRRPGISLGTWQMADLVAAFGLRFPEKFLNRTVPYVLWLDDLLGQPDGDGRRALDARWLDVADALPRCKARATIAEAAARTAWRAKEDAKCRPGSPAEAEDWLRCAALGARSWYRSWCEDFLAMLSGVAEERAAEEPAGWAAVLRRVHEMRAELCPEEHRLAA